MQGQRTAVRIPAETPPRASGTGMDKQCGRGESGIAIEDGAVMGDGSALAIADAGRRDKEEREHKEGLRVCHTHSWYRGPSYC